MKLQSIKVENFKAIKTAKIPTSSGLTVIVGQNSSGKSSVLQAIHWACRSVANSRIQNNQSRSVAVHEFDYYPTENTRLVGNKKELRQARGGNEEISVSIEFEHSKEHETSTKKSKVLISQGNNDAVKIDLRNNAIDKDFYELLSDMQHPFSSYIPGLAGIPLSEEKRSRQPVLRQAASGAANTVLRNILEQIREDKRESVSLEKLSQLCSKVLGDTSINVDFRPESDFNIKATIKTDDMSEGYTAPLEMAGTGVLQCIQIFSYILLYQPKLLLIDEPDAHLHPDRQEKLALALAEISKETETSIIITTHSPNLVRALPSECKLIWMKSGEIAETGDSVRKKMGWGILDKKNLLITEDSHPTELKSILNQWPDLSRHVAVWPVSGHRSLPTKDACKSLLSDYA
ncbi:ATP-dependent nuclease [Halomonas mongoliensis]|uniref:ATP-dependent nuclease n=1 Tax=Halomonas mongoliensis TaxID=321265 RepID=UPI00403AE08A